VGISSPLGTDCETAEPFSFYIKAKTVLDRARRILGPTSLAGLLVAAAVVAGAPARAVGTIQGRVVVTDVPVAAVRPSVTDLGPARPDPVDRRRAVVYLDWAPQKAFEELPARRARMDQRGEQFAPRVLAITVGTIVDFPNNDAKFHNVFSLSRVKKFDLGRYPVGRSKAVTFDKPGIVPVFCDIHSHMSAYILVFSHPFFAVTDAEGRYAIPNVPPGNYRLMIWSELGQAAPRNIVVSDGVATEADFRVSRQP
jgi:plastocyanin